MAKTLKYYFWCVDCADYYQNPNRCRSRGHVLLELRKKKRSFRSIFAALAILFIIYRFIVPVSQANAASFYGVTNNVTFSDYADTNFSSYWEYYDNSTRDEYGLMQFDTITTSDSTVDLHIDALCSGYGAEVEIWTLSSTYDKDTITRNNTPSLGHLLYTIASWDTHGQVVTIDTTYLSEINNGILLKKTAGDAGAYCSGYATSSYIETTDITPTPTVTPTPTPTFQFPYYEQTATTTAQFQGVSRIYYTLRSFREGGAYWVQIIMHNKTDDWSITDVWYKVRSSVNYSHDGEYNYPSIFPVTGGRIETVQPTDYIYTLISLDSWIHDVYFTACNDLTDECVDITAPVQGEFTYNDTSDTKGLTDLRSIIPDQCNTISLGIILIPDYYCMFTQWFDAYVRGIFSYDVAYAKNKFITLWNASNTKFPWAITTALVNVNLSDPPLATYTGQFPDFYLPAISSKVFVPDQRDLTLIPETSVSGSTFSRFEGSLENVRNGFKIAIAGLFGIWLFNILFYVI
jgi:hypothetical protein